MVTVQHIVRSSIREKPLLHEGLRRGIINHAALAEDLQPTIEKQLGKEVTFSSVNMAIRRVAEQLQEHKTERVLFDTDSDISVRSHLVEITFFKSEETQAHMRSIYDLVNIKHGDFLTITQGLYEVMIITNEKYKKKILNLVPKRHVKNVISELSTITVHISPKATETVGLFYVVTRALNWENINIIDIVSTYTELTFLILEKDTGRAFDTLKNLIASNSQQ